MTEAYNPRRSMLVKYRFDEIHNLTDPEDRHLLLETLDSMPDNQVNQVFNAFCTLLDRHKERH